MARRVCTDAPGARVVITADHGFIYTRRELNECQMLGKPDLPFLDAPVMHGKRHLVVPNEAVTKLSDEARGCLLMLIWDFWVPALRVCPARERAL